MLTHTATGTSSGIGTCVHPGQDEQTTELCKQHHCRQQHPGSERHHEYKMGAQDTGRREIFHLCGSQITSAAESQVMVSQRAPESGVMRRLERGTQVRVKPVVKSSGVYTCVLTGALNYSL